MRRRFPLIALVLALAMAVPAAAADVELPTDPMAAEDTTAIDAGIAAIMEEHPEVPAFYVGIWSPERGSYRQAYGLADVAAGRPASVDDHFRIGSVSKTFGAAVILQLVDEGLLALDDTVADADPELAVVAAQLEKAFPSANQGYTFIARPLPRLATSTSPQSEREISIATGMLIAAHAVLRPVQCDQIHVLRRVQHVHRRAHVARDPSRVGDEPDALVVPQLERGGELIAEATPPAVSVVDTTGAGDTFTAALTLALVEGQSPDAALQFACAAGAAATTRMGAQPSLPFRDSLAG